MQINQTDIGSNSVLQDTALSTKAKMGDAAGKAADKPVKAEKEVTPSTIVTLSTDVQNLEVSTAVTYEFGGGGVKKPPP